MCHIILTCCRTPTCDVMLTGRRHFTYYSWQRSLFSKMLKCSLEGWEKFSQMSCDVDSVRLSESGIFLQAKNNNRNNTTLQKVIKQNALLTDNEVYVGWVSNSFYKAVPLVCTLNFLLFVWLYLVLWLLTLRNENYFDYKNLSWTFKTVSVWIPCRGAATGHGIY